MPMSFANIYKAQSQSRSVSDAKIFEENNEREEMESMTENDFPVPCRIRLQFCNSVEILAQVYEKNIQ